MVWMNSAVLRIADMVISNGFSLKMPKLTTTRLCEFVTPTIADSPSTADSPALKDRKISRRGLGRRNRISKSSRRVFSECLAVDQCVFGSHRRRAQAERVAGAILWLHRR